MSSTVSLPGSIGPLRHSVFEQLRESIIRGDFHPGEHLIEIELAEQYGVSRGPIREALHMLAQDGWVDLRPRHGAFVHTADLSEIEDLFAARRLIEGETAYLAAVRAPETGPDALDQLHGTLAMSREQIENGTYDPQVISGVNYRFHNYIAALSGNRILVDSLSRMSRLSRWYYVSLVSARAVDALDEHSMIADAIVAGDGEAAREMMRRHIDSALSAFTRQTERVMESNHAG